MLMVCLEDPSLGRRPASQDAAGGFFLFKKAFGPVTRDSQLEALRLYSTVKHPSPVFPNPGP